MGRLQDKVIVITGAAQGMGETHARKCLEHGAKVCIRYSPMSRPNYHKIKIELGW